VNGGPIQGGATRAVVPVVVIGAGPVGQTTALLLARWGIPVIVLERRAERVAEGSRSICQQRDVLDIWAHAGVPQIAAEGVTWTTARTYYRDALIAEWSFADPGASPLPPFVNISQSRTEQLLDLAIAAEPLIEVRRGWEVIGVDQDAAGVTVSCAVAGTGARSCAQVPRGATVGADPAGRRGGTGLLGGASLHDHGGAVGPETHQSTTKPDSLLASYVVACAGAKAGWLREQLGISLAGRDFGDKFLICDVRAELPGAGLERRFYFDPPANPGRQILIHPCPGGAVRIDWQVPPGFDLAAERASGALDARIRQLTRGAGYELLWSSVYTFSERIADRMVAGRVLLAGDCAHLVAPFGARGLNSGVQDAENAAWKIAFILRGWGGAGLIESYHAERHAAAEENLQVTGDTMRFLVPQDAAGRARRERVLERAAAGRGGAGSAGRGGAGSAGRGGAGGVDSGRLAEPFWYTSSPLTTPDPGRSWPGRPAPGAVQAPGPGVLMPDGLVSVAGRPAVTRLRQLLRNGLTLLIAGSAAAGGAAATGGSGGAAGELGGALGGVTGAPLSGYLLDRIDTTGAVRAALGAADGEVWLVRPDGHCAAVVNIEDLPGLTAALRRTVGCPDGR
jgi:3-(3-hydroxy-phenyl)propionate hydroxylase